ncbi:PAS domain-containing sensor histidine kinase [Gimesia panareensis]|uniref:PAS domain-containing sensor histidine kinase n=1 Tax=Gimesia panareensis TaxID=2527978 RepID=UPI001188BFCE|nr:PAS domain-containing sensor histidine kinase [Gimesia panareensis]QDU53674.1 Sensor protein FixL [Gimesia panareensis]
MSHSTTTELLEEVTRLRRRVGELEQQKQFRIDGASTEVNQGHVQLPLNQAEHERSPLTDLPCAVIECDVSGRILFANPAFASLHGTEQDELVDTFYAELIDAEEERVVFYQLLNQLASGSMSSHTHHTVYGHRDGHSIPVQVQWGVQRDASGSVTGLLAVVSEGGQSTTENDKAIDLAGQYFSLVREMILVVDADEKVSLINQQGCRLLGGEEADILGRNWFDHFLAADNREEDRAFFQRLMQQGAVQPVEYYENDVVTFDGTVKRVAWHFSMLQDESGRNIGTLNVAVDITERKEERQALRESRQIFHQISENINELLWVSSADVGKIYYLSPKYEEFWGQTCQSAYDDPRIWVERIHPDDREALLQSMNRKIQGDFSSTEFPQFRVIHTDGSIRWLESRSFPVYNGLNEVTRLVGIIEDITQRKQDEEAILKANETLEERVRQRTSELTQKTAQLKALFQALPDLVLVMNYRGEIVNFNSRRKDLFSPSDLSSGRKIWDLLPEEMVDQFAESVQQVYETRQMRTIDFPLPSHRQNRWYRARVLPYLNEEVLLIIENISEQKVAEIDLKQTHERLSEAQRLAHIGSWEWNVLDDSLWWSDEVFRIFGLKRDSFRPTYPGFLETIHPDDRPLVERVVAQTLEYDLPYSIEHRIVRPNGEVRYVHEQGALKRNAAGEIVSMHGTVQDISDRQEAARKTREYRDILAHTSRLAVMGELTAGISHELNQPLTAIANYSSAIKSRIEQGHDVRDLVQRIETLSLRSGSIVRRLKSMAEKREQELIRFNILGSIHSTLQLIEYELHQKKIKVQVVSDSRMTIVHADRVQIEQVLSNLFLNAMEAMAETPLPRILTITVSPAADSMIQVTVSDTGTGVPDHFVGQLFTPFASNKQGGLGIGLSLSRSLVEASGGKISYRQKSVIGATFDVLIPTHQMSDQTKQAFRGKILSKENGK